MSDDEVFASDTPLRFFIHSALTKKKSSVSPFLDHRCIFQVFDFFDKKRGHSIGHVAWFGELPTPYLRHGITGTGENNGHIQT